MSAESAPVTSAPVPTRKPTVRELDAEGPTTSLEIFTDRLLDGAVDLASHIDSTRGVIEASYYTNSDADDGEGNLESSRLVCDPRQIKALVTTARKARDYFGGHGCADRPQGNPLTCAEMFSPRDIKLCDAPGLVEFHRTETRARASTADALGPSWCAMGGSHGTAGYYLGFSGHDTRDYRLAFVVRAPMVAGADSDRVITESWSWLKREIRRKRKLRCP